MFEVRSDVRTLEHSEILGDCFFTFSFCGSDGFEMFGDSEPLALSVLI